MVLFSCDDNPETINNLCKPNLNFLCLLSENLDYNNDKRIIWHALWIFSNLLGDKDPNYMTEILKTTQLIDFLADISNWKIIPKEILRLLPWLCLNIIRREELP